MKKVLLILFISFLGICFQTCSSDNTNFRYGLVRYFGDVPSTCGWVIEMVDEQNVLHYYRPSNLDIEFQIDNLPVEVDFDVYGPGSCINNAFTIDIEEIIVFSIRHY